MIFERLQGVDRELDDGHVSLRGEVGKDAPGAVVEPPLIPIEPAPVGLTASTISPATSEHRGRIVENRTTPREAVEIVDGAAPGIAVDRGAPKYQWAEDDQQRPRPRSCVPEPAPPASVKPFRSSVSSGTRPMKSAGSWAIPGLPKPKLHYFSGGAAQPR